jgi:hypothetical protein
MYAALYARSMDWHEGSWFQLSAAKQRVRLFIGTQKKRLPDLDVSVTGRHLHSEDDALNLSLRYRNVIVATHQDW